ncbi:MAG: hypothetical protein JNK04_05020, partial [Myxococcales bacterium]|nr:hypothetical protein [Myxococcales bacterium]
VTPMKLLLEKGDAEVTVELALDGYETKTEKLVPNVDQRLSLSLTQDTRSASGRGVPAPFIRKTAAPPPATASAGKYRKFN